ncbi:MAG: shikimate dehydrogenase [Pyrinomonadaceae bacterium]
MNNARICVSLAAATAEEVFRQIARAAQSADIIEIRFDHLNIREIEKVLSDLPQIHKQYLFTFRPIAEGGRREISLTERLDFWTRVRTTMGHLDFMVDLEQDLELPFSFGRERTIVSSHNFGAKRDDAAVFGELLQKDASIVKIADSVKTITDSIPLWHLLERAAAAGRSLIPIAMGEAGKFTRILGPANGTFLTYAALENDAVTAPGQLTMSDLNEVYRIKRLDPQTDIYGIVAGDSSYSVSPYMHNPAFVAEDINAVFVPLQVADLSEFIVRMVKPELREVEINFKGFSITNPHKQAIISHLDAIDDVAKSIGAVNTIKIENGKFHGYNTDAPAFIEPLIRILGDIRGMHAAIAGAGGAARACVYSLKQCGADVTILGRDVARAAGLADEFGVRYGDIAGGFEGMDILVNATPLGTKGAHENVSIARGKQLHGVKLVYDLNYNPVETMLIGEAALAGIPTISGLEMLVAQGARQFEIWTGRKAPLEVMRHGVEKKLALENSQ